LGDNQVIDAVFLIYFKHRLAVSFYANATGFDNSEEKRSFLFFREICIGKNRNQESIILILGACFLFYLA